MKKTLNPVPSKTELILGSIYLVIQWLFLPTVIVLLFGNKLSVTRLNCLLFAVNFAVTVLIFHKFLQRSAEAFVKAPGKGLLAAGKGLGIYWLASVPVSYLILLLDPEFANINDANIAVMVSEDFGLMAFCTVLLVPVAEELLYRGIFFGGIHNRSPIMAFVCSAMIFSIIHVVAYVGMYPPKTLLLCFLQYIPAGVALAWSWAHSGNILSALLMHISINAVGIFAMR